jgi:hypothetical protein
MIKKAVFGLAIVVAAAVAVTAGCGTTPYAGAALTGDEAKAAGFASEAGNGTVTITGYTEKAKDVAIPGRIDGLPVTAIGAWAFETRLVLASVTIPASVTSIGAYAFFNCVSLASVTIPGSVTAIGESAFFNCVSLASVTIPDGVTSIGAEAFAHCSSLASVTIPASVTRVGHGAFYGCPLNQAAREDIARRFDTMGVVEQYQ